MTISVRDIEASIEFYSLLGYQPVLRWKSGTSELQISHLELDGSVLELFAYANSSELPALELTVGNNIPQLGVRHFGLSVENIYEAHEFLLSEQCEVTEVRQGRTMIDFFYVKDPDGVWVEIVRDARTLSPGSVVEILEKPD
ncbi:MAG TPA: VOC family protein [Solirubrobacterales bacterium]|nr:VOC family protein [Solirubrobacterales bacterium]